MAKTKDRLKTTAYMLKLRATSKRVRIAKSNSAMPAGQYVTRDADTTQRAGRKKAVMRLSPILEVPPTGTTKSASGKRPQLARLSNKVMPSTGSEIADHLARKGRQFPAEILQWAKIYRQLQSAILRINNQIKAIQKYDPTAGSLDTLKIMYEAGKWPYRDAEKQMIACVRRLPIWTEWAKHIKGIGENILGQILGETKDPARYPTPSHLWSRMELGRKHGHNQQRWSKNRKGYTQSENIQMATDMGYGGRRKTLMYKLGSCLLRAKNVEYGKVYRDYKERKLEELPPVKGNYKSKKHRQGHAHKMAMRYMEKRFLLNLWKAWRGQFVLDNLRDSATTPSTKKKGKAA